MSDSISDLERRCIKSLESIVVIFTKNNKLQEKE